MATVSIIVPMYNVERFISRTLNSIIKQTYKDIEIIIIDDGSSDQSVKIAQKFAEQDGRIKLFRKANGGLSSARNEGIKHSSGKYCMFIDSDDFIDINMVKELVDDLEKENADMVVSGLYLDYENNDLITITSVKCSPERRLVISDMKSIVHEAMVLKKKGIIDSCCNKIYKKSIIMDYNLEMPLGEMFEDTEFNFKYLRYTKKIVINSNCFYHYMQRNKNRITNSYNIKKFDYLQKRVITMKNFVQEYGNTEDIFYVYYWYVRYVYSTLMDIYNQKEDIYKWISKIQSEKLYTELSNNAITYPNILYKLYIESFLKNRRLQIYAILRISNYLKMKRNNKS